MWCKFPKFAPRIFREKDMATVTAFIRVSTKKTKEANVRFRLRDGRTVQLLYSSDITVNPEQRPIYEVLSSHCARKAFSGNMYDKVPDPNLICPLTGHKEGSKAFNRYRKIDEETNRKTITLLE